MHVLVRSSTRKIDEGSIATSAGGLRDAGGQPHRQQRDGHRSRDSLHLFAGSLLF
jgi:hypothetical protein